jgi:hypothetical protein
MRKLVTIVFAFVLSVGLFAQKPFVIFGNAPDDLFTAEKYKSRGILDSGTFLWSLDAVVSGAEISFNKEGSVFDTSFLSGVGGAVGYKHYKPVADGLPVSDYGVNLAVLTKVQIGEVVSTKLKLALLANVYNFTLGPSFTFGDNRFGLLVGANINF